METARAAVLLALLLTATLSSCNESPRAESRDWECETRLTVAGDGVEAELSTDAAAAIGAGGTFYHLAATDFRLDEDVSPALVMPSSGKRAVILAIRAPRGSVVRAGDVTPADSRVLPNFTVAVRTGAGLFPAEDPRTGSLEVLALSENRICIRLEETNARFSVIGTIDAAVKNELLAAQRDG